MTRDQRAAFEAAYINASRLRLKDIDLERDPATDGYLDDQADASWWGYRAAIELDRQGRGEPVGKFTGRFTGEVNGDALFVVKAYGAIPAPGAELYTAPQPADLAIKESLTVAEPVEGGLYAVYFRDNWDGEGDTYWLISRMGGDGKMVADVNGKPLLEHVGDALLRVIPLDSAPQPADQHMIECGLCHNMRTLDPAEKADGTHVNEGTKAAEPVKVPSADDEIPQIVRNALVFYSENNVRCPPSGYQIDAHRASADWEESGEDYHGYPKFVVSCNKADQALRALDEWLEKAAQPAASVEPAPVPWRDIVSAIRAVGSEAARRGRMFPQASDEQDDDRRAVRRVVEMIEWYASHGGEVAMTLPDWPTYTTPVAAQQDAGKEGALFDLVAHLHHQREWSVRTFGPGSRAQGVVDHIRKELLEIEADPGDVKEWVDVIILGLDGAWRTGATPEQIAAAIRTKQSKNEGRTWPDWRTMDPNKAIEHDRSSEARAQQSGGNHG